MDRSSRHLIDEALQRVSCHLPQNSRIIVGLSGGVDSSVSLALLKELGYDVVGLFMKNWEEDDNKDASAPGGVSVCPAERDFHDVALTAKQLGVPYFSVNFAKEYKDEVFDQFIQGLKAGKTPNPDILCNLEIKFKHLLNKALQLGADGLATGHYAKCRLEKDTEGKDHLYLCRACDSSKDQTYFLYTASQKTLAKTVFPLANLLKSEVRALAKAFHIPVAEKKDSTGICFIGKRDFRSFISSYVGYSPGNMVTVDGHIVGQHQGLAYHTVGQRRGLGIGGQGSAWFVAEKRLSTNELVVVQGENHPALFADELYLNTIHWISGAEPPLPFECTAKIRYRQPDQPCIVERIHAQDETSDSPPPQYRVRFLTPQRAITEEQSCVLYLNDICLGGGFISCRGPSYFDMGKTPSLS